MTQATHTPGPWFVSYEHGGGTEIAIDDAFGIDGGRDYDLVTVTHGDPEELKANAALVSAAPELLEALQEVFVIGDKLVDDVYGYEFALKAKAAIAKALTGCSVLI